jgi:hypothetical protein
LRTIARVHLIGGVPQPNDSQREISVEAREREGREHVLFTRSLDPQTREDDRGSQTLRLELPSDAVEFVLRSSAGSEPSEHAGRPWWAGVSLERTACYAMPRLVGVERGG